MPFDLGTPLRRERKDDDKHLPEGLSDCLGEYKGVATLLFWVSVESSFDEQSGEVLTNTERELTVFV